MQNALNKKVEVILKSEVSKSFYAVKAAQSLDIDVEKKSVHHLTIQPNIREDFKIGMIIGSSGSGKTTLAKKMFGEDCFKSVFDLDRSIIDQFDDKYSYDERAIILNSIGLSSVPCWIKPAKTLSNGQRARAEAALAIANSKEDIIVLDEWTSVVDRTVAKVMSHCINKFSKKFDKRIILLSCHFDVIEWVDPDWIINCNDQSFLDRGLLRPEERERKERLEFTIRAATRESWKQFSKYHYLNDKIPGGRIFFYGLFHGDGQIGFICFANYTPKRPNKRWIYHFNRIVIHPDYAGFGLGIKLITESTKIFLKEHPSAKVMGLFSSIPVYKAMIKNKYWRFLGKENKISKVSAGENMERKTGFRQKVTIFRFEFRN